MFKKEDIIARLPEFRDKVTSLRDVLVSNLVMIGETPSPTFGEDRRVALLQDRFIECGLTNPSTDEMGNALGVLPGKAEKPKNILLAANVDTVLEEDDEYTVEVQEQTVTGAELADNGLGPAVLATLPTVLDAIGIKLQNNLVFCGAARSLGRGDLAGLRLVLDNSDFYFSHGICLESLQLGNLSYYSMGTLRGEMHIDLPKEYNWTRPGIIGSIQTFSDIVSRITEIPLPRKPQTYVVLGSIHAGNSYNILATEGDFKFEILSESAEMVDEVFRKIEGIAMEVSSMNRADIAVEVITRRDPGGLKYDHPLPRTAAEMMKALGVEPKISPSTSMLSAFSSRGIPAVAMGLTTGHQVTDDVDVLDIAPMSTGVAQLIGLVLAIDNELCNSA